MFKISLFWIFFFILLFLTVGTGAKLTFSNTDFCTCKITESTNCVKL